MPEALGSGEPQKAEWEVTKCPLCASARWKLRLQAGNLLYGLPGPFRLVQCRDCGHVYVSPRPTRETIGRFYTVDYPPHLPANQNKRTNAAGGESRDQASTPWYLSRPVRSIPGLRRSYYWLTESHAEILAPVDAPGRRALELGCAVGRFLGILRDAGWQAEGLEPASIPVAEATRRGFRVHQGTLEPGRFPEDTFDAVYAWMVLEHLHDPAGTLREVKKILKPDGWLIFSVPNWGCWEPKLLGRYWYSLELPLHLHQFTPRILRRMLAETGFGQVRIIHQHNVFNLVGTLGLWLNEMFPGSRPGTRLLDFIVNPSVGGQLALAPLAKLLAWLHQGGRLTVTARVDKAK